MYAIRSYYALDPITTGVRVRIDDTEETLLDLDRILAGDFSESDERMARSFARWLAGIHSEKRDDPHLYWRGVRDLIGSSA